MPGGRRAGPTRTRQAIIDVARAQFAVRGYDAVSLRAIAREAGCSGRPDGAALPDSAATGERCSRAQN